MKKTLILSSHILSDYQQCPQRYQYSSLLKIEPAAAYSPFSKGTAWSKTMEDYYNIKKVRPVEAKDIALIINTHIIGNPALDEDMQDILELRFMQYAKRYKYETIIPIACEAELMRTLYEDDEYHFIYAIHPDLIAWIDSLRRDKIIYDHKTQSREDSYYPFNNQAQGYCWATGIHTFSYNYTGLQSSGDLDKWFRRQPHVFTAEQLESWRSDTIEWAFKIAKDERYLKSWQCSGKFGKCWFSVLCEQTHKAVRDQIIARQYRVNTEYDVVM